ncbi:MAG TPA: Xaa-Pro peptidase family protein, partial [Acidimicrobiales bacterium]
MTAGRQRRLDRVREAMGSHGVDALLLSLGADLPWLTGYEAMPLERLTMLVLPVDADASLVIPALEAPRCEVDGDAFSLRPWSESEDPVEIVAGLVGGRTRLAISDRTWATFLIQLERRLPQASWQTASSVTSPLRAVKDDDEVAALVAASRAADRVAARLVAGDIPLIGQSEAEVSADISRRLIDEGHRQVNFAIVGSGPNSASPHHDAGRRRIGPGEAVVCDFGGVMDGYCSDITRTVFTGEPPAQFRELYAVLQEAQAAAVAAAAVGTSCEEVDATARGIITEAGYGPQFIHRTGHGIGLEEHEDPYIVAGNRVALAPGHAFSVEPGIYLPGVYGARIEDIVVAQAAGPLSLNA